MTALEVFRMVGSEFSAMEDEEISKWIELATPLVSKKVFGKTYEHAIALLTAHKLKMNGYGDSSVGTVDDSLRVSSYSEGSTSIGFSVSQGNNIQVDAEYALTVYGLQYLTLRRQRIIPIRIAGER